MCITNELHVRGLEVHDGFHQVVIIVGNPLVIAVREISMHHFSPGGRPSGCNDL